MINVTFLKPKHFDGKKRFADESLMMDEALAKQWESFGFVKIDSGETSKTGIVAALDDFTVSQLKTAAEAYEIDLGEATKKADIIAVLEAAGISAEDVAEAQKE